MEKRIDVTNNTANIIYAGSYMIPPGETRPIPESQVPPHLRPVEEVPAAEPQTDQLAALLGASVNDVVAKFGDLPDADLARLIELETAGKARKTLIEALDAELTDRALSAAAVVLLEGSDEEVLAKVQLVSDPELERAAEIEATGANREHVLSAIAAEQIKRKG